MQSKPTGCHQYLNYLSFHHIVHKQSLRSSTLSWFENVFTGCPVTNVSKNDENSVFFSFLLFFLEKNKIKMADYSQKK